MPEEKILVTGANGQIGTVLTEALREAYGTSNVLATDIKRPDHTDGPFMMLDILNVQRLYEMVEDHGITQVYHLAAILSASGEWNPQKTWNVNLNGLLSILEMARQLELKKVFFPSTIAVFGKTTPRVETPQHVPMMPETVYGISKTAGELLCNYYNQRYGLDVRSVRYPGIIGYQSLPHGGTTDYAVEIFHSALKNEIYECFLAESTSLPMLYMPDAVRATLELMEAPSENISIRTSYNLAGMSFNPAEIASEIQKHLPDFQIRYKPDHRQDIASSWSESIDDSIARKDWGWMPAFDLASMTVEMLEKTVPK